jgi:hypothetical protein
MCGKVLEERRKIVSLTYQLRWSFERKKQQLEDFVELIRKNAPKFTAANFFLIDNSTVLSILETIISFVIVMAQFHN